MRQPHRKAGSRLRQRLLFTAVAASPIPARALVFNLTFDPSVTTQPDKTQIENACNYVAQEYEYLYSNPVTLNIEISATSAASFLGESIPTTDTQTYSAVRNALIANATSPDQIQAYSTLPTNSPTGATLLSVPTAEDKILGLSTNGATSDGQFIFSTAFPYTFDQNNRAVSNDYDFLGVVEHEFSHLMGRVTGVNPGGNTPFDLFRYVAPGTRTFFSVQGDYFSINAGATNLNSFDSTTDPAGWVDSGPDAFNAFTDPGVVNDISSPADTTLLDVLGYTPITTPTLLTWSGGSADPLTASNWFSGTLTHLNPHVNVALLVNSPGATITHNFNANENFTLGRGSDNGVSLTVNNGTFTIAVSGSVAGGGYGLIVQQNGLLALGASGLLNVAGPLSVASDPNVTNASASFSGASVINVGTNVGTDQTFYVGQLGIGAVTQSGSSTVNAPTLDLGDSLAATGTYSLAGSAHLNISGNEYIGYGGNGAFNQSGGIHAIINGATLNLGYAPGSTGAYSLTAGSLTVNGSESIGEGGAGFFTQSGGLHTVSDGFSLIIGDQTGATGAYTLTAGALISNSVEYIAYDGSGFFNQTGGSHTVANNSTLYLGFDPGATGSYSLAGGTLAVTGVESVGESGLGFFTQSGGLHSVAANFALILGDQPGATGSYTLTAGALVSASNELIGFNGTGTLNQSGGSNTINGNFNIDLGFFPGATGTYLLSNTGTLTDNGSENIGFTGGALFLQTGGLNTIVSSANLNIGRNAGGYGIYTLTAGTTAVGGNAYVGGSLAGPGGAGSLIIGGPSASLAVAGTLTVFNSPGSSLTLTAGSLTAPVLSLPGGTYSQSGGSASFRQITGAGVVSVTGGKTSLAFGGGRSSVASLSISGSGLLDITNNSLAINFASPAADPIAVIAANLASGYNGGAWTGTSGIISSTAQAHAGPALSVGYADGNKDPNSVAAPNQIVVKYTLVGDTNLDGVVNFTDLVTVVQNYMKGGTDWAHGNFGYGPTTDFADLVAVIQNINKPLTPAASSSAQLGGSTIPLSAATQIQSTDAPLPEPASLGLLALAAPALFQRRRNRRTPS